MPDCNAAIRDGDWKLIRPVRANSLNVPDNHWLWVSNYGPEHFIHHGICRGPYPDVGLGPPLDPLLFNIKDDPLERNDLAAADPDRAARLGLELDRWFEDVERDRLSIADLAGDVCGSAKPPQFSLWRHPCRSAGILAPVSLSKGPYASG